MRFDVYMQKIDFSESIDLRLMHRFKIAIYRQNMNKVYVYSNNLLLSFF